MTKKLLHKSRGVDTASIYKHAWEQYTKLSNHIAKLSNTPERKNKLKIGKKDSITM